MQSEVSLQHSQEAEAYIHCSEDVFKFAYKRVLEYIVVIVYQQECMVSS